MSTKGTQITCLAGAKEPIATVKRMRLSTAVERLPLIAQNVATFATFEWRDAATLSCSSAVVLCVRDSRQRMRARLAVGRRSVRAKREI
jgi:hypothetical protein